MVGDGGAGVSYLRDQRARQEARRQALLWPGGTGRTGLASPMQETRRVPTTRPEEPTTAPPHDHDAEYTNAQAGGLNIWVQATAPTALSVGDVWIQT